MASSQQDYTRLLVQRFEEEFGGPVKVVDTPFVGVDASKDLAGPGRFHGTCRTHVGGLSHLVRHTRPDGEQSVFFLQREVTRWSFGSDLRLIRVIGYFKGTDAYGMLWRASETVDVNEVFCQEYSASDYGQEVSTGRSTSGWCFVWVTRDETTKM